MGERATRPGSATTVVARRAPAPRRDTRHAGVLGLHQQIGNRAVTALLQRTPETVVQRDVPSSDATPAPRVPAPPVPEGPITAGLSQALSDPVGWLQGLVSPEALQSAAMGIATAGRDAAVDAITAGIPQDLLGMLSPQGLANRLGDLALPTTIGVALGTSARQVATQLLATLDESALQDLASGEALRAITAGLLTQANQLLAQLPMPNWAEEYQLGEDTTASLAAKLGALNDLTSSSVQAGLVHAGQALQVDLSVRADATGAVSGQGSLSAQGGAGQAQLHVQGGTDTGLQATGSFEVGDESLGASGEGSLDMDASGAVQQGNIEAEAHAATGPVRAQVNGEFDASGDLVVDASVLVRAGALDARAAVTYALHEGWTGTARVRAVGEGGVPYLVEADILATSDGRFRVRAREQFTIQQVLQVSAQQAVGNDGYQISADAETLGGPVRFQGGVDVANDILTGHGSLAVPIVQEDNISVLLNAGMTGNDAGVGGTAGAQIQWNNQVLPVHLNLGVGFGNATIAGQLSGD